MISLPPSVASPTQHTVPRLLLPLEPCSSQINELSTNSSFNLQNSSHSLQKWLVRKSMKPTLAANLQTAPSFCRWLLGLQIEPLICKRQTGVSQFTNQRTVCKRGYPHTGANTCIAGGRADTARTTRPGVPHELRSHR